MINIEFDDSKITKALQELQQATGNLSPANREIGEQLSESTKQRFSSGTGPDGQKWADNSQVTIERKGRNKPLVDSGTLMAEINYQIIDNNTLEIGSPMEYAAMQQFGGTKDEFSHLWGDIPARPFLGISSDDEAEILNIIEKHLTNNF